MWTPQLSALSGCDYNVTGDGDTKRFIIDPDQQSVEFRFEILEDSIVEYVESFSISLENAPENEPRFETQGANTCICHQPATDRKEH